MWILDDYQPALTWSYKTEKQFEAALFKEYRRSGKFITVYHIPDIWLWSRLLDWICIDKTGWTTYLELKIIHWYTFNVKKFEDNQVELLYQMDKAHIDTARVWIWSSKANDYKILRFSDLWKEKNEKWGVKIF